MPMSPTPMGELPPTPPGSPARNVTSAMRSARGFILHIRFPVRLAEIANSTFEFPSDERGATIFAVGAV